MNKLSLIVALLCLPLLSSARAISEEENKAQAITLGILFSCLSGVLGVYYLVHLPKEEKLQRFMAWFFLIMSVPVISVLAIKLHYRWGILYLLMITLGVLLGFIKKKYAKRLPTQSN